MAVMAMTISLPKSLTGHQTLIGGSGRDSLNATGKVVKLDGGDDSDYLSVDGRIWKHNGSQYAQQAEAILHGGEGSDNLSAEAYSKAELYDNGNDNLRSGGGSYDTDKVRNSFLFGESGDDQLSARVHATADYRTDGDSRLSINRLYLMAEMVKIRCTHLFNIPIILVA